MRPTDSHQHTSRCRSCVLKRTAVRNKKFKISFLALCTPTTRCWCTNPHGHQQLHLAHEPCLEQHFRATEQFGDQSTTAGIDLCVSRHCRCASVHRQLHIGKLHLREGLLETLNPTMPLVSNTVFKSTSSPHMCTIRSSITVHSLVFFDKIASGMYGVIKKKLRCSPRLLQAGAPDVFHDVGVTGTT